MHSRFSDFDRRGRFIGKLPTTMWKLLIWAYRNQMVQYETDRHDHRNPADFFEDGIGRSGFAAERGCINGAGTTAHDDAHTVHSYVMGLHPRDHHRIIASAAKGFAPDWNPDVPVFRVVPVRKGGSGSLRMIYGKSHRPIGCMIDYEGVPPAEAEAIRAKARDDYRRWWNALAKLHSGLRADRHLTRWTVTEIGAPEAPWKGRT